MSAVDQVQVPTHLVEKYVKSKEILEEFLANLSDLIQYLVDRKYIRSETAEKWREKIKQAYPYLGNYEIIEALQEIYNGTKGLQFVLDKIESEAFWKGNTIPEDLRKKLEVLAESWWKFKEILRSIINYYTSTYNSPPIIWASWTDKVDKSYFWIKDGDINGSIATIISIMKDLKPLIDEMRNQILTGKG